MNNLILNEWFLHDLNGDNGEKKLRETSVLLSKIINEGQFKIFILDESPWIAKARKFAANSKQPTHELMRLLFGMVIRDGEKCEIIGNNELSKVPQDVLKQIPPEDAYLIKLSLKVPSPILVSTDYELIVKTKMFESEIKIKVFHRDNFISQFTYST